jgi:hypothetical protein
MDKLRLFIHTQMGSKTTPLVLVMFALVGALSAGAVPAAIAQEDTSLGQDLAGGIGI